MHARLATLRRQRQRIAKLMTLRKCLLAARTFIICKLWGRRMPTKTTARYRETIFAVIECARPWISGCILFHSLHSSQIAIVKSLTVIPVVCGRMFRIEATENKHKTHSVRNATSEAWNEAWMERLVVLADRRQETTATMPTTQKKLNEWAVGANDRSSFCPSIFL